MPPEQLAKCSEEDQEIVTELDEVDRFVAHFGEHAGQFLDLVRSVDNYKYRDYFIKTNGGTANTAKVLYDVFEFVLMDTGLIPRRGIVAPEFVTKLVQRLFNLPPRGDESNLDVNSQKTARISREHGITQEQVVSLINMVRNLVSQSNPNAGAAGAQLVLDSVSS
jgi:hypothetical protein